MLGHSSTILPGKKNQCMLWKSKKREVGSLRHKEVLQGPGWTPRKGTQEGQFCQLFCTKSVSAVQQSEPKGFQCHRLMVSPAEAVLRRAVNI